MRVNIFFGIIQIFITQALVTFSDEMESTDLVKEYTIGRKKEVDTEGGSQVSQCVTLTPV